LRGIGHHPLKAIRIIWWYLKFGTKIFKDNPYVEVILIALQKFAGTYHHILTGQVILISGILIERFYCITKTDHQI